MNKVYFLIGGNLGNKKALLNKALKNIAKNVGKIIAQSSLYETAPWGFVHESAFLNQAVLVETDYNPMEVLVKILAIELSMGRKRDDIKWKERTIDIDILFFNDITIEKENLRIPHPHLQERKFALIPLNEIAPELIHPQFKKTVSCLLSECKDKLEVKCIGSHRYN